MTHIMNLSQKMYAVQEKLEYQSKTYSLTLDDLWTDLDKKKRQKDMSIGSVNIADLLPSQQPPPENQSVDPRLALNHQQLVQAFGANSYISPMTRLQAREQGDPG
jgi:hypothetical protein